MTAVDDEGVVAGLLDEAGVDELRHQAGGGFAVLYLVLQLIDPALEIVDGGELEGLLGGLLFFLLLLGLDLCFSPAPLRAHFEHLGADAFAHCDKRSNERSSATRHLQEMAVDCWKAAATSGSIAIMRSFCLVTLALRASI